MHIPGILGMPRRIYTYDAAAAGDLEPDHHGRRIYSSPGLLVFVYNLCTRYFQGKLQARPVGCMDAGVVHVFAAPVLQLCN